MEYTMSAFQCQIARGEEHQVQLLFFRLDFGAHVVYILDEGDFGFFEDEGAFRVQTVELIKQRGRGASGTPDYVDPRSLGASGELFEGPSTDSACAADEKGNYA